MSGLAPRRHWVPTASLALLLVACTYDFDAPFAGGEGGSASTSTATSPSTTGDGGATTSQGGGTPGDEDCGNGRDDDGDGDVDCQDASCEAAGFACAPPAPAGFLGPVVLVAGSADAPPECAGAFPDEVLMAGGGELVAPPATCTACTCDAPTGASCTATLSLFADDECLFPFGSPVDVAFTGAAGCADPPDPVGISSARASIGVADGGACAPGGGTPTADEAVYEKVFSLCAGAGGGGCAGACLPPSSEPGAVCVYREGAVACAEASPYTVAMELHAGVDDTRSCTACACGDPEGITCGGATTLYRNNDTCSGQSFTLQHDGSCASADDFESYRSLLAPGGGACAPSGGEPEGAAAPSEPITVCCLP